MLKVTVACDNCGTQVELKPVNKQVNYSLVNRELLKKDFYISNIEIEANPFIGNYKEEFINELLAAKDSREVELILHGYLWNNIDVEDKILESLRVNCNVCGSYIDLKIDN